MRTRTGEPKGRINAELAKLDRAYEDDGSTYHRGKCALIGGERRPYRRCLRNECGKSDSGKAKLDRDCRRLAVDGRRNYAF